MHQRFNARLFLEDGSVFKGTPFGAAKAAAGEVVFSTGMVGYPESLTDPSYKGQILVLTYPLIGNYGVPKPVYENGLYKNFESERVHVSALIVSSYSQHYSHWAAVKSLGEWLNGEGVPAITGIDTRALTQKLREKGTMLGRTELNGKKSSFHDPNKENLVEMVSGREIEYKSGKKKVLLFDCGVKNGIIRSLLERKLSVKRVPWDFEPWKGELDFDAAVISNGPGDPKMAGKTIESVKWLLKQERPVLGICLGNQIIALASGADTFKLKYGHRSQNQPCTMSGTKKCFITTQNHGYAVRKNSLKKGWEAWFVNANDKTVEGIRHRRKPFMAVQFHPEASPGPEDTGFIFDDFLEMIK